jgi:YgiT-type zinc finger domain-containing protein
MKETMVETQVTYTLLHEGKLYVIEHVPARVCVETGEQFFAPETVQHIHALIKGQRTPTRVIETQVYDYA